MQCLLCGQQAELLSYGIPPRRGRCSHCGAKPRHRELGWFFQRYLQLGEGAKVLEVGPSKMQARYFATEKFLGPARYTGVDVRRLEHHRLLQPPHRFMEMDVTRLSFSDACFDVILCNHVLPYIRSDYQAMSEMHRCLKASGLAVVNVSFQLPKTRKISEMAVEDPALYTPEYQVENGTEWAYGEDYLERLEAAGFFPHRLRVKPLAPPDLAEEQRFRDDGELILCFKYRDARSAFLERL